MTNDDWLLTPRQRARLADAYLGDAIRIYTDAFDDPWRAGRLNIRKMSIAADYVAAAGVQLRLAARP